MGVHIECLLNNDYTLLRYVEFMNYAQEEYRVKYERT